MANEPTFWTARDFHIGRATRNDDYYLVDSHAHRQHEFYYLMSGTRRQVVDNRVYDISAGDIILIPKKVSHMTSRIDHNQHSRYLLNFSDELIAPILEEMGDATLDLVFNTTALTVPEDQRPYLLNLLDRLYAESRKDNIDKYSRMLVRSYMTELFAFIIRLRRITPVKGFGALPQEERIQMALRYISDHYNQDLTLQVMAKYACTSETYFSKKFRRVTGLNFSEYLTSVRLEKAEELLSQSDLPVSVVAGRCGFSNGNYFGTVFRTAKGMSPVQYRKTHPKIVEE